MNQHEHILVLNRTWVPIATTTVQRGLSLVIREHARIVDHVSYEIFDWNRWLSERSAPRTDDRHLDGYVNTVSLRIQLPTVIALGTYGGVPSRQLPFSRRSLFRRDNFQCQYCGCTPGVRALTIDHVMPRSRGGDTSWNNCVVSCVRCNVRKGSRTPEEAAMRLRRPTFRPNFFDGLRVSGEIPAPWRTFVVETHDHAPVRD